MTTTIYGLLDPRNIFSIRYVGKTRQRLITRLNGHLSYARRTDRARHHSAAWMRSVMADGYRPLPIVLEVVPTEQEDERERWWIARMRELGHDLTNTVAGGEGLMEPSANVREQMSENATRQFTDQAQRDLRSKRMRELWADPEWRAQAMVRAAASAGLREFSQETRDASRARMQVLWERPGFRERHAEVSSAILKSLWQDPEYRAMKLQPLSEETRAKISAASQKMWDDEEWRAERKAKAVADREARTHCKNGHEYTEANTYYYKSGAKTCRRCGADSAQRRRDRLNVRADPAVSHEKRVAMNLARWADPEYRAKTVAAMQGAKRKGRAPGKDARPQQED